MVCLPEVEGEYFGKSSSINDSFDVDSVITSLLADSSRASIELPRKLSAEQRKHAKKVVEQYHPGLKCESFGLGQDRQVHIFKRASDGDQSHNCISSDCSPQHVSVKNTFIDDWIQPATADARNVQSMPHNMFAQRLSAEMSGHGTSTVEERNDVTVPTTNEVTSEFPSTAEYQYTLGSEVVIDGLIKAPQFNGASGSIESWDAETNRYNIVLNVVTAGGQRWAKVKGQNLHLVRPVQPISFGSFGC